MLVIAGEIRIDPAHRDRAQTAAREMRAATLQEPGCHAYVFSLDLDDASVVHLFECWESDAALKAHFATPHMARFREAIAGFVRGMDVQRYEVSSVGPLRP